MLLKYASTVLWIAMIIQVAWLTADVHAAETINISTACNRGFADQLAGDG
jgi:hypothetical protein